MVILSRPEFIDRFDEILRHHGSSCANDDHVIWEVEKAYSPRVTCQWFVCAKPLKLRWLDDSSTVGVTKSDYWFWITSTLSGQVVCYSSDNDAQEEWWGFTDQSDVPLWLLKWGR